jgi:hypothetical protein
MGLTLPASQINGKTFLQLSSSKNVAVATLVLSCLVLCPFGIGLWFIPSVGPIVQLFFNLAFLFNTYKIVQTYNKLLASRLGEVRLWSHPMMMFLGISTILTCASIGTEVQYQIWRGKCIEDYYAAGRNRTTYYDYYYYYNSPRCMYRPYSDAGSVLVSVVSGIFFMCMINTICLASEVLSYVENVYLIGYDPLDPQSIEMMQPQSSAPTPNVPRAYSEKTEGHRPTFHGDIASSLPEYSA